MVRIVAVTGGRDAPTSSQTAVFDALGAEYDREPFTLHVGCARGIDSYAVLWAEVNQRPFVLLRANWEKHGRSAGAIRNTEILKGAALLLAFPGGVGTADCVKQAKSKGIDVVAIT